MSPGWQINKSPEPDVKVVEQVEASAEAVAESPVEPTVEVPAREIVSHVVGGTATALDTQRRLVRVNAEDAKKGRAKSARASAAAKKSAVAKTASVAPTVAVAKKAGTRRKGREMAMQMLFQADIGKQTAEQVRNSFWNAAEKVDPDTRGFAEDLFVSRRRGKKRSTHSSRRIRPIGVYRAWPQSIAICCALRPQSFWDFQEHRCRSSSTSRSKLRADIQRQSRSIF